MSRPFGVVRARPRPRSVVVGVALAAVALSGAVVATPAVAAPTVSAAAPVAALPPGGSFVPVAPRRVLDTRRGGTRTTSNTITLAQALPGVDPSSVAAVLFNVTVVDAPGSGYVVVGASTGSTNGNFVAHAPSATLALAAPIRGNTVPIQTSVPANVVVDVQGWVTTPAAATADTFTALPNPVRVADTRRGYGLSPFGTGQTQRLDVRARADLPSTATAVIANVTVAKAAIDTYVTAWSGDGPRPTASTVNAARGQIVANRVLLPLSADGYASFANYAGRTDLVVDISGYVSPSSSGSWFTPVRPGRVADLRGASVSLPVTVDSTADSSTSTGRSNDTVFAPSVRDLAPTTAVWLTLVGDQPLSAGYLAARPDGTDYSGTSDLNLVAGRAVANAGPVRVSPTSGTIAVLSRPTSRIVADLSGWFRTAPTSAAVGLWQSEQYYPFSTTPLRRSTVPAAPLPASFANGVVTSDGTRTRSTAYAIQNDGTVADWARGESTPVQLDDWGPAWGSPLAGGGVFTALASAGDEYVAAVYGVTTDGRVYATGSNRAGGLGSKPSDFLTLPLRWYTTITLPAAATVIGAAPQIGYAVLDDGRLFSWGRADTAQLGRTATSTPWVPAEVTGAGTPSAIAGDGRLTFAIDAETGLTTSWGTPVGGTAVTTPTPVVGACVQGKALHADVNGVWELCSDGSVVQLDDDGARVTRLLPVSGVTQVASGSGPRGGVRVLLTDGTVADVDQTATTARLEAGFAGVTRINGTPGVQLTLVGGNG